MDCARQSTFETAVAARTIHGKIRRFTITELIFLISMFYGIIIRMLFMDTQQHHLPHCIWNIKAKAVVSP
jgi:hypothetical protein